MAKKIKTLNLTDLPGLSSLSDDFQQLNGLLQVVTITNCPKLKAADLEKIASAKGPLRKLHFSFTSLERVPASLLTSSADALQYLNLSNNKITELPDEV